MTTNGEREREPVRAADRMPPCNLRAEEAVLGACLLEPALVDDVSLVVQPDDFYRAAHTSLFSAMLAVRDAGTRPDLVAVAEHLERTGRFASVGGDEMLAELVDAVPHAADATYHAKIVAQKATARRLIEASNETMRECYANELDASALLERAESRLFALAERGRVAQIRPIREVAAAVWRRLTCRRQGEYPGVATGLYDLDGTIDGMKPGAMLLIAARPSIGKTALGLTIAEHAVLNAAVPTLFISLEMDAESLGERLLVMGARVDGHLLRTGRCLAAAQERNLENAQARLESCQRLWIDDSPVRTVAEIHAAARLMRRRHGLELLIVDYLQLIEPPAEVQRRATRQEQVARISARLKQIARDLAMPIVVLCQLNRAPEARADKRPQLGDLRESGALEQDADVVLLLHRPEFYDETDRPGEADLIVAKQRNGRTGVVRVTYRKEMARFESASDRTADFL